MPEILCPKCKVAVTVYADGSLMCEACNTLWASEADLEGKPAVGAESKPVSELTDEELAKIHERIKANAKIEEKTQAKRERQRQEQAPRPEVDPFPLPFEILGTANDGLTYFIDRSERLLLLRLGNLTKVQLFLLADRDWWEGVFAGARGRMDLDGAINFLIKAANGKSFDSERLRGRGCWREE